MSTDYDAPRTKGELDSGDLESLDVLQRTPRARPHDGSDIDEADDVDELFELPGADLSTEEFTMRVIPQQPDEFVCSSCHLVQHRRRRAPGLDAMCSDCA